MSKLQEIDFLKKMYSMFERFDSDEKKHEKLESINFTLENLYEELRVEKNISPNLLRD
jgi:hypothetical protein